MLIETRLVATIKIWDNRRLIKMIEGQYPFQYEDFERGWYILMLQKLTSVSWTFTVLHATCMLDYTDRTLMLSQKKYDWKVISKFLRVFIST